jgi:hypothetical protein
VMPRPTLNLVSIRFFVVIIGRIVVFIVGALFCLLVCLPFTEVLSEI